jgi:peptidoglycan-associated lipoprotein
MNKSTRVLLVSLLSVAVLAGCSKKVKEEPAAPVDTGTSTTTPTGPSTSGLYGPGDLDTDACLRQRCLLRPGQGRREAGIPGHHGVPRQVPA